MEIETQVNQIVQNILADLTTQIRSQVATAIDAKIDEAIKTIDYNTIVKEKLSLSIDSKLKQLPIDTKSIEVALGTRIDNLTKNLAASVEKQSMAIASDAIKGYVNNIDFPQLCQSTLMTAIKTVQLSFPANSIPAIAINRDNLVLSGDNIQGGIIANFGSTGIDDKATDCRLSIFDDITVVENNLITKDLTVKGSTTIEGDLIVTGRVPETSAMFISVVASAADAVKRDVTVFDKFSNVVFDKIKNNGLDLTKLTFNQQTVIDGNNLGTFIVNSNLQKVGLLKELQVQGESFLSQTLYVTDTRVGINTIEPTKALNVWDQEVEIAFGKQTSNTAVIETPRNQSLILSSNGKNNIELKPDGSIAVHALAIGSMKFSVDTKPPSYDATKGTVVFNSNPSVGGPMGWVSLGDARWANFGIID